MHIHSVADLSFADINQRSYDLALFCSGYEDRCVWFPDRLPKNVAESIVVLGFAEFCDEPRRREHDEFFSGKFGDVLGDIPARDDRRIYEALATNLRETRDEIHILVDYTSMSRIWYASVLNWFRVSNAYSVVEIDFCYAGGRYTEAVPEKVIGDVICVPGCEGAAVGDRDSVALFGLGFERLSPYTIVERTEPKEVFAFYASPGADPDYPERAITVNKQFLDEYVQQALPLPLDSVNTTYVKLGELIAPYRGAADVSVTPCGPKPHVLASILLGLRFSDVACLYVAGRQSRPINVAANGYSVLSRVRLVRDDENWQYGSLRD